MPQKSQKAKPETASQGSHSGKRDRSQAPLALPPAPKQPAPPQTRADEPTPLNATVGGGWRTPPLRVSSFVARCRQVANYAAYRAFWIEKLVDVVRDQPVRRMSVNDLLDLRARLEELLQGTAVLPHDFRDLLFSFVLHLLDRAKRAEVLDLPAFVDERVDHLHLRPPGDNRFVVSVKK